MTAHSSSLFPKILLFSVFSTVVSNAALTVTLHPDGVGGTVVSVSGSGTTDPTCSSQLCNNVSFQEQWSNMSGNPFDDTANVNNADFFLGVPIPITPSVSITGIQIDNDGTGDNQDDFKILINANLPVSTAYAVNEFSTLTTTLPFSALSVGTYTDDTDGGTTFLGGFSLVISSDPVPEPSTTLLGLLATVSLIARRRR